MHDERRLILKRHFQGGVFELLFHFPYRWNIAQKSIIQIFDMLSINKFH